jgi:hypothetical protein
VPGDPFQPGGPELTLPNQPWTVITVNRFPSLLSGEALGTRHAWGEAWWTARDLSLENEPELGDPMQLREAIMAHDRTRALAEDVIEGILVELSEADGDDQAPEWVPPDPDTGRALTVSELRQRLRLTLSELAARDGG